MKRGFWLSINMIVVVILGIVILTAGVMIVKSITCVGTNIVLEVDQATRAKVDDMLTQGEILAVPEPNRNGGADLYVFYLGFANRYASAPQLEFKPEVERVSFIDKEGQPGNLNDMPEATMNDYTMTLNTNEHSPTIVFGIDLQGNPRGTYTYKIVIKERDVGGGPYDNYAEKLIRINVVGSSGGRFLGLCS